MAVIISKQLKVPSFKDPNTRYESKSLGIWNTQSDVNTFLFTYNHDNNYEANGIKLSLGNYVTIRDGTYNVEWEIAGFDCEHNATASDGTVYDNGYGILMIPKTQLIKYEWHDGYSKVKIPYMDSDIHSVINFDVYNALKTKLGDHIVQRNVLLGSACNGTSPRNATTSAYTWTTSYLTLMSIGQMNGAFKANNNQYDDGEANYKLPLFNYEDFKTGSDFWSRCVWGHDSYNYFNAWCVYDDGSIDYHAIYGNTIGVRPLMLLR